VYILNIPAYRITVKTMHCSKG